MLVMRLGLHTSRAGALEVRRRRKSRPMRVAPQKQGGTRSERWQSHTGDTMDTPPPSGAHNYTLAATEMTIVLRLPHAIATKMAVMKTTGALRPHAYLGLHRHDDTSAYTRHRTPIGRGAVMDTTCKFVRARAHSVCHPLCVAATREPLRPHAWPMAVQDASDGHRDNAATSGGAACAADATHAPGDVGAARNVWRVEVLEKRAHGATARGSASNGQAGRRQGAGGWDVSARSARCGHMRMDRGGGGTWTDLSQAWRGGRQSSGAAGLAKWLPEGCFPSDSMRLRAEPTWRQCITFAPDANCRQLKRSIARHAQILASPICLALQKLPRPSLDEKAAGGATCSGMCARSERRVTCRRASADKTHRPSTHAQADKRTPKAVPNTNRCSPTEGALWQRGLATPCLPNNRHKQASAQKEPPPVARSLSANLPSDGFLGEIPRARNARRSRAQRRMLKPLDPTHEQDTPAGCSRDPWPPRNNTPVSAPIVMQCRRAVSGPLGGAGGAGGAPPRGGRATGSSSAARAAPRHPTNPRAWTSGAPTLPTRARARCTTRLPANVSGSTLRRTKVLRGRGGGWGNVCGGIAGATKRRPDVART